MSELSPSQIASAAMALLAQNPIADIEDATVPNAVKCNAVYAKTRDALLREYNWGFATRRVSLEVDATAPAFGYLYRYLLPADYIRLQDVHDQTMTFELEDGYLLTDWEEVSIKYTARVVETGRFDALFTELLTIRIARELAYGLLKKLNMVQAMDELYKMTVANAKRVDASESRPAESTPEVEDPWITRRR